LIVRLVAEWDPEKARARFAWPIRDLLSAYVAILRRQAEERYKFDLKVWATLAPHQEKPSAAPRIPKILRA
jgi:hypothetical protein